MSLSSKLLDELRASAGQANRSLSVSEGQRVARCDAIQCEALAATNGADGRQLLQAVEAATELPWLREVAAVQTLRQVWAEQYTDPPGPLRWRAVQERLPAAALIASPYDVEAR